MRRVKVAVLLAACNVCASGRFRPHVGGTTADEPQLNRAWARSAANAAGQLVLTFTNKVRLDFAATWAAHVRRLGMTNWLIGATDRGAMRGLRALDIPSFSMRTNLPEGEWDWGSPSFKALGQHKVELIHKALSWGLEVVITDVDALVLHEPFAFMDRWRQASFLTTSDHLANTTGSDDGGLEDRSAIHSDFNIGYMFFRPSALPLVRAWRRAVGGNPRGTWDQGEFNRLARTGWAPADRKGLDDARLFWSYGREVVGGILPARLFCGGHHYFVSRLPQRSGISPWSIHTTFQYGGAAGKRHRLREAMVWEDPPEYYNASVLAFEPSIDPALLPSLLHPAGGMDARRHVALMLTQLRVVRAALALAHALGRVLVLPRLVCGYDKYWATLSDAGVIGGAHAWALPIVDCPLDHMLNPAELSPSAPAVVREHSFLSNRRFPRPSPGEAASTALDVSRGEAERRRLESMAGKRLLTITNLPAVAHALWGEGGRRGGLLSPAQWRAFRDQHARLQGGWCCAPRRDVQRGMPRAAGFHVLNS